MPDRICVSISLKSMHVPGLQLQAFAVRNGRQIRFLIRMPPGVTQGEEVTLVELVFGSDSKARGLPRPYTRPVFKTSLFSG